MSNPHYSKVANTRNASTKKIGHYGRGQIADPKVNMNTGAATTKGNAPTGTNKELGGKEIKLADGGNITGTAQGMGAAKKGGKYTWVGSNVTDW